MSERSVARRYAAALFDVAKKAGRVDQAGAELQSIIQTIDGHAELRRVFETPAVPAQVKKQIVTELLKTAGPAGAAGSFSGEVSRMVVMLAERDRLGSGFLNGLCSAYAERLLEEKRIVPAEVTTAAPLSEANRAALTKALATATGRDVTLTERVDPSIVGGVVARVGSLVFDGSVTRQLERLRQKLATNN